MEATALTYTPLAAGQSLHLALDAGTVLVAAQGGLFIAEPSRWLAERVLPVGCWLGEGQAHVVTQAGWVCVTAQGAALLAQTRPAGMGRRLLAWLAQWAGARQPVHACPGKV